MIFLFSIRLRSCLWQLEGGKSPSVLDGIYCFPLQTLLDNILQASGIDMQPLFVSVECIRCVRGCCQGEWSARIRTGYAVQQTASA